MRLTASDSQFTASDDVTITVTPAMHINQPPVVDAGAAQTIQLPAGADLSGTVIDDGLPQGGTLALAWSVVSGPGEVTFVDPEAATTTARFSLPGTYVLRLTADDLEYRTSDDVTITVEPAPVLNDAPVVEAGPNQTLTLPAAATLNGSVTDDGFPEGGALTSQWSVVSGPGPVTFADRTQTATTATFVDPGTYVLRLSASDSQLTSSDDVTVTASAPAGAKPTVSLTSPADGAEVTTFTDVTGSVSGGIWKLEYRLDGDAASTAPWTVFASGNGAVSNAKLGVLDPTMLLNGTYAIRLTATTVGGSASVTRNVVVKGNLKIGNFTLTFTDLDIPMAGIPIQLLRTYDSRDKRRGDFGIGWTLSIRDVRLEKSAVLGQHWEQTRSPGVLPTFCLRPTRPLIVTITFSTGKVYKFEAITTPQCQQVAPLTEATLGFRPVAGTRGSLAALDDSAALVEMTNGGAPGPCELTSYRTFTAINPRLFRLTTEDGIEYVIHQRDGLQSIKDLNGNTITINANGLIHSLGKSVTFVRDGQGRIAKITDPAGNAMTYAYDANGDLRSFTDREGNTTTFAYDETHRLLTILDPLGRQAVRNEYDEHGRLVSHTDASGNTIRYAHDLAARHEIVTDRLGRQTLYEYDASGNVVRVTAPDGAVTQSTYDAQNNKLTETDALGNTTRYTYDAAGNPTSVTDPLGNVQRFTRNARGQLLSLTDPLGRTATTAYDGRGNLTSVTDPAGAAMTISYPTRGATPIAVQNASGQVTRLEYDASGNPIKVIDTLNNVRIYTYDANNRRLSETLTRTAGTGTETLVTRLVYDRMGRVVEMIRPNGTVERTAYDPAGRVILETDALGRAIRSEYDELGRLVRTIFPDETWESTSYDPEGNRTSSTDRAGRVTHYEYGANGKLAKVIAPDGTATTSEYDLAGRLIKSVDPDGNATLHEYNAAGRNTKVTDALGNVTLFSYDAAGNLVARTDANGNTTRYEYDGNNRRTRTVYADGTSEVTAYDSMGNLREQIDQLGHVTKFEHDALNRLASVVDALGGVTSYAYDEAGNRVTQTDAAGRTTRFEYDRARRLVRRTLPSGLSERFEYDTAGRRTAKIDFNGARTEYRYNAAGRLIEKRPDPRFGMAPIVFSYRPDGSRASMVDASGTTEYEYDAGGRLTAKHTPQGILRYTYDGRGNLASLSSDASDGVSVRYSYDRLSRLVEVIDERLAAGTTRYTYDATGNLASMAQPSGVQTSWAYDALHRLVEVAVTGGVPLARYAYTLAVTGHRAAVTELGGRTVTYGHDALSRLIDEAISGAGSAEANGSIRYAYDAVSNRLSRVSTIAAVPGATYAYDPNDRLTSDTYDANGNTLRSEDRRFEYDFEDHLQKLVDGNQTFVYDGDGNCVAKTVEGITTRYLVDTLNPTGLPQVMEERVDGAVRRVYTYGLDLLCQRQIVDGAFRTSFYLLDGQGSVRALTDESGSVTDTYDYDSFGNLLASTGSTANERRYRGEWFDARMGLYSLRARYYDPATGRFTTSDPFLGDPFAPVSLHRYLYANANPIAFHDPTGLFSMPSMMISTAIMGTLQTLAIGMLKGALLGVAINVVVTLIENYLSGRNLLSGLAHSAWSGAIFGALAGTGVLALPYVRAVAIGLGFGMAMVGAVEAFLVEQNYSLGAFRMVLILLPFIIAFRTRPRRSGGDDLETIYIAEERLQMLDNGSVKIVGEDTIWFYVAEQAVITRLRLQGGGWLQAVQVLRSFMNNIRARAKPIHQASFPDPTYINRRGSTDVEQYGITRFWFEAFENAIRELDDRFITE
ncbi:MAG TPA: RHS repeat-associated core domain-containing protein [Thermoanaerobaculia bacterium]